MNITINKLKKTFSYTGYGFLCALACFAVLWGCATVPRETDAIASVDGEAITVEDLIYSLNVSHRVEDLSSAGELDISEFIQRLVDELLVVQEARRMGMEDYPETRKKVDAYVLRESVVRLYNDEILKKVTVSEAELRERFRRDHERFTLSMIAVASQEEAAGILERLTAGEDFGKLAREHSANFSKEGEEKRLKRKEMSPALEKALIDLTAGEISGVISTGDKSFYIVKLIERQEAAEEEFEHVSNDIKNQLSKIKENKRGDEYLAELRAKADIEIDREVLDSLELGKEESRQNSLKDERVLVKVNDTALTAGDFAAGIVPSQINSRERALNSWIDIQVVNDEALRRQYELRSDLKDDLWRYKRQLLKKLFANKVIIPGINISREEVENYYVEHKEDFTKPGRYKIQQITLKTMQDALDALDSLNGGASFSWLAKRSSKDEFSSKGGAAGWQTKKDMPASAAKMIDTIKSGEISPVIEVNDNFRIIMLQEKSEPEFEELGVVMKSIQQRIFRKKYDEIYKGYVDRLKKDSRIEIYEEAVESYKARFRK